MKGEVISAWVGIFAIAVALTPGDIMRDIAILDRDIGLHLRDIGLPLRDIGSPLA